MRKLVVALSVIAIVFFIFANHFYNQKIKNNATKANAEYQSDINYQKTQEKQKNDLLTKNKNNSVIDWLKYLSISKDPITISILGSSVTQGAGTSDSSKNWGNLISNYLHLNVNGVNSINLINNGYGGYTTSALIRENKDNEVVKNNPDVVIFELCLINNYRQNVSITQTKNDITDLYTKLHFKLPNTLIIFQTANPISEQDKNGIGLTYGDYNQQIKNYIQANNWNFINTYELYSQTVNSTHLEYKNYLKDDIHPNDDGNKIWFDILKDNLSKVPANMN